MKHLWQVFFREAKRDSEGTQGASTGDDDFADEDADDAAADEGAEELGDEDETEDEPEEESEDDQSDEDQDAEEEEEGEEEEGDEAVEDEPAKGFRFKDPKTGDFDFKRINKAVGGDELEKRFKEQDATITRTFQELKSFKDNGSPQDFITRSNKAKFLDDLIDNDPVISQRVVQILSGQVKPGQSAPAGGQVEIPKGVNPEDPLWPVVQELRGHFQAINNRQVVEERTRQQNALNERFSQGLEGAKAKYKELTGFAMPPEKAALIEQEMRSGGYLNGARLVPGMFFQDIQAAMSRKVVSKRVAKKNLPKAGISRRPAPTSKKKRNRDDDRNDLWDKHMGDGMDD